MSETFHDGRVTLHAGDCLDALRAMPEACVDSVVTDPPYHLTSIVKRFGAEGAAGCRDYEGGTGAYKRASRGFMGKQWDGGDIAFRVDLWREVFRVLKPGGHLVAFSGTRTYHRMACAIEDAGFEIRDQVAWLYGSGFPKSHDVSKAIDKAAGGERERGLRPKCVPNGAGANVYAQDEWTRTVGAWSRLSDEPITENAAAWAGWGTALKPAIEPICVARKPLAEGSVAANVLKHGTGALHVDACRVAMSKCDADYIAEQIGGFNNTRSIGGNGAYSGGEVMDLAASYQAKGRWPANVVHDGSDEVVEAFPETAGGSAGGQSGKASVGAVNVYGDGWSDCDGRSARATHDSGSAARFFYSAKADGDDRLGSKHPTVKPVDLMRWLTRLVTPPGGIVLDPFAGTGTTGEAALREGFRAVLIEREAEYRADIAKRMGLVFAHARERREAHAKAKPVKAALPLFAEAAIGVSDGLEPAGGGQISRPQQQILCRTGRTIGPIGLKR